MRDLSVETQQLFHAAQQRYDVVGMADVIHAHMEELLSLGGMDSCGILNGGHYALACAGEMALACGRPEYTMMYFIDWLRLVHDHQLVLFSEAFRYLGIAGACLGHFDWAEKMFARSLPGNEENAAYEREIAAARVDGRKTVTLLLRLPALLPHGDGWRDVPIFINSRDRLNCLQQLVSWLRQAGYRRIYILDNASTYAPLLSYYESLKGERGIEVIRLPNLGHVALWSSGILDQLDIKTVYVYTDSDVLPQEGCPKDIVRRLYRLLRRYPFVDKAGPGIEYRDITFWDKEKIQRRHPEFYRVPLEQDVYFAPLDTTFALYRPVRSYRLFSAIRTTGAMMVRHLPWYLDAENLPEDERYYMAHANESSTQARTYHARRCDE